MINQMMAGFLLAFPALFSIINPLGSALIYQEVTGDRSAAERRWLAGRIGLYSLVMLLVSLWLGSYVLAFFGVSLAALRIAGGLVVAVRAWEMLSAPEAHEERKQEQAAPASPQSARPRDAGVAFFPLTMPFTVGPGTISVAVALTAAHPPGSRDQFAFTIGSSLAGAVMAVLIWLCYRSAERFVRLLGTSGARIVARIAAFLLLCIGTQIIIAGVVDTLRIVFPG
ncbi:MarC family integral membrane protein [Granulibacter bethesdensis]|uniref:MarC family protein n=1 Tax=Granulibacter bethesdensis TaxID=364410 RepID=UPI000909AD93|nr:MarC family protein [Granulibacter bethesdensis]APH56048.1 MarC family integral membrane protein [Granulibacter bethesdensis]